MVRARREAPSPGAGRTRCSRRFLFFLRTVTGAPGTVFGPLSTPARYRRLPASPRGRRRRPVGGGGRSPILLPPFPVRPLQERLAEAQAHDVGQTPRLGGRDDALANPVRQQAALSAYERSVDPPDDVLLVPRGIPGLDVGLDGVA